ncbi:MAG: hypothetical protein KAH68_07325 [Draconibacterium sp.]|nr:hypothetical protein [Draconibacterium sp.]
MLSKAQTGISGSVNPKTKKKPCTYVQTQQIEKGGSVRTYKPNKMKSGAVYIRAKFPQIKSGVVYIITKPH